MAMTQEERDAEDARYEVERPTREAMAKIVELESEITPRRIREAVLGLDNGWLLEQEALIATERTKL